MNQKKTDIANGYTSVVIWFFALAATYKGSFQLACGLLWLDVIKTMLFGIIGDLKK
jgi:hypothetical protein